MNKYDVGTKINGRNDTGTVIAKVGRSKVMVRWSNGHKQEISYPAINKGTVHNCSMITPPVDMVVGYVHPTKYGALEVVKYANNRTVTVRFLLTGAVKNASTFAIRADMIRDPTMKLIMKSTRNAHIYAKGDVVSTKNSGKCKVVRVLSSKRVDLKFVDTGYETTTAVHSLSSGSVKDYLMPTTYGRGFLGDPDIGGRHPDIRTTWKDLMRRSYSVKCHAVQPTYADVSVCEEWWDFRAFVKWTLANRPAGCKTWQIDKDMTVAGNKIYSPETCAYVPQWLNSNHLYRPLPACSRRGDRYYTTYRGVLLSHHSTKEEAQDEYAYMLHRDTGKRIKLETKLCSALRDKIVSDCERYCADNVTSAYRDTYQKRIIGVDVGA